MYFPWWIVLVALSLYVSVMAFVWGLKSGQFADQNRARYLPLRGEPLPSYPRGRPRMTAEAYVLLGILVIGFMAFAAALALGIYHLKG